MTRRFSRYREYEDQLAHAIQCEWCEVVVEEDEKGYWRFSESRQRGRQCNECRRAELTNWLAEITEREAEEAYQGLRGEH